MRTIVLLLVLVASLILAAPAAHAIPITFAAVLSGPLESPPNASPGTGQTTVVVDAAAHSLIVDVTFSGLVAPTTASHIHCCVAPPGTAGVATTTPTFPNFPLGVTSGTYHQSFDLTLASSYNPAFVTANGGVGGAEAALETGILAGNSYLNIHSQTFPNGEIRGFLVRVPAPATLLLLGTSLAGLGGIAACRGRARS